MLSCPRHAEWRSLWSALTCNNADLAHKDPAPSGCPLGSHVPYQAPQLAPHCVRQHAHRHQPARAEVVNAEQLQIERQEGHGLRRNIADNALHIHMLAKLLQKKRGCPSVLRPHMMSKTPRPMPPYTLLPS